VLIGKANARQSPESATKLLLLFFAAMTDIRAMAERLLSNTLLQSNVHKIHQRDAVYKATKSPADGDASSFIRERT
jgi:hypothetical protein